MITGLPISLPKVSKNGVKICLLTRISFVGVSLRSKLSDVLQFDFANIFRIFRQTGDNDFCISYICVDLFLDTELDGHIFYFKF